MCRPMLPHKSVLSFAITLLLLISVRCLKRYECQKIPNGPPRTPAVDFSGKHNIIQRENLSINKQLDTRKQGWNILFTGCNKQVDSKFIPDIQRILYELMEVGL